MIMLEMSAGFEVQEQIQANTVIQPCMSPKNLFQRGANVADHRYYAPTVASIAASSARDRATSVVPKPAKRLP